jgi:hypothetical protein
MCLENVIDNRDEVEYVDRAFVPRTSKARTLISAKGQYRKYPTRRCGAGRSSGTIPAFNPTDEERSYGCDRHQIWGQRRYNFPCRTELGVKHRRARGFGRTFSEPIALPNARDGCAANTF